MMTKDLIRLIEYFPYSNRNECCAIGFLVFNSKGEISAHTPSNLKKVKALDPSCNLDILREGINKVALDIQTTPEVIKLYEDGFQGLRVSKTSGYISYSSSEEFQNAINWILKTSVEPKAAIARRQRDPVSRLYLELKGVFSDFGWLARPHQQISDHRIIPRYSLSQEEGLNVDFALKNGVMNCVQTIDYRHNTAAKKTEAQAKLLTLGYSHQIYENSKAYAVIAGAYEAEAKSGLKLAERTADDIFIHESSEDMSRLMNFISVAIGQETLPTLTVN